MSSSESRAQASALAVPGTIIAPHSTADVAMASLGGYWWAKKALQQHHLGRYRFGYRRGEHNIGHSHAVGQRPPRRGTVGASIRRYREAAAAARAELAFAYSARRPSRIARARHRRTGSAWKLAIRLELAAAPVVVAAPKCVPWVAA